MYKDELKLANHKLEEQKTNAHTMEQELILAQKQLLAFYMGEDSLNIQKAAPLIEIADLDDNEGNDKNQNEALQRQEQRMVQ